MTDPTPSVTCKFAGRTYSVPAGSAADVRGRLSDLTGIYNLKLLSSGRTLADSDTLAPNAKVMVIKCAAAAAPTIRLSVREIVTGRLAPKAAWCPTPSWVEPMRLHGRSTCWGLHGLATIAEALPVVGAAVSVAWAACPALGRASTASAALAWRSTTLRCLSLRLHL